MSNTGSFRSAINGFNRQDVQDYLESAAARYNTLKKERNDLEKLRQEQSAQMRALEEAAGEWEQKLLASREELEAALTQNAGLEGSLAELQEQLEGAAAELAETKKALGEEKAARSRAEEACRSTEGESEETVLLRSRLAEAESKVSEYELVKERLATLELDASRRAAEIEREARLEAEAILRKAGEEAEALKQAARTEAEAIRSAAKEAEAAMVAQRAEASESFRTSLRGAASETDSVAGKLSDELGRFTERLKEYARAMTAAAAGFDPPSSEDAEAEAPCSCPEGEGEACACEGETPAEENCECADA